MKTLQSFTWQHINSHEQCAHRSLDGKSMRIQSHWMRAFENSMRISQFIRKLPMCSTSTSLNKNRWMWTQQSNVAWANIQIFQLKRALHTEVCAHLCWKYARTNAHKCAHWAEANAHKALTKNALKHFYVRKMHRKYAHSCIYVGEMHKKYAHSANQWMRTQQNVCANNNFMSGKCTRNMRMHLNLVSKIYKKYAHSSWRTAR